MAVAFTVVAGEVEGAISEDFPGVDCLVAFLEAEDLPVHLLRVAEGLVAADLASVRRSAARGAIAEEDTEVVTAEDLMEAGFRDTTMEATITLEGITEGTTGTIIEDMPPMEQPLGSFSVG